MTNEQGGGSRRIRNGAEGGTGGPSFYPEGEKGHNKVQRKKGGRKTTSGVKASGTGEGPSSLLYKRTQKRRGLVLVVL